jgi:Putative zinc-finger
MSNKSRGDEREHKEISTLLPWYVNGSIGEHDRSRVDAHLAVCAACREELSQEWQIHRGMSATSAVEYLPAPSLKRLQARLDAAAAGRPAQPQSTESGSLRPGSRALGWTLPWQGVMAASVSVMAVALSLLAADRWMQFRASSPGDYHTVTISTPHAPGEVIRAVFSPNITLVELQMLLSGAGLRIVSGPTEAGVYSLARNSPRAVSSSLAALRAHAAVRFAEATQETSGKDEPQ